MNKRITKIKVLYRPREIRGISIQCPECRGWFDGDHILDDFVNLEEEIIGSECTCPRCSHNFEIRDKSEIQEVHNLQELEQGRLKKR